MDLSDGLGLDLHRFADASGVGFDLSDVPVADGATSKRRSAGRGLRAVDRHGRRGAPSTGLPGPRLREPLSIGRVVADVATRTLRGVEFERRGWQHQL